MVLPPELAFGEQAYGMIPANSPIILVVELISIEKPPRPKDFSNVKLTVTETGLSYFDLVTGEGDVAEEGLHPAHEQQVVVDLLDGLP